MIRKIIKFFLIITLLPVLFLLVITGLSRIILGLFAVGKISGVEESPSAPVAVVFGAGLTQNGTPTAVLKDRMDTAVQLYHLGKVEKLLVSGDNRFVDYNEPQAMYLYAIQNGVPAEDIVRDYAGRRTYDTCYRALHIFGVNDVLLVTQNFHLPRALYLCQSMGIKAHGISADTRTYRVTSRLIWLVRESMASLFAFLDIWVLHPLPVLGTPEPIFPPAVTPVP